MSGLVFFKNAKNWFEALPIGNGKTAVMVYGGKKREELVFNDAEFWSGYPKNHDNPNSLDSLKRARELVFGGEYRKANECVQRNMNGDYSESFMPLGRIVLDIKSNTRTDEYCRKLSLDDGEITVDDGATQRTAFVSYPHKIAVYGIKSQNPFSLKICADSLVKSKVCVENGILSVYGNAPDFAAPNYLITKPFPIRYNEHKAMAFCLACKTQTDGEIVRVGKELHIKNATYVRLFCYTATGFCGYDKMPETDANALKNRVAAKLSAEEYSFDEIYAAHKRDYHNLWNKQTLKFNGEKPLCSDVAKLLDNARNGNPDTELISILYDFGKYLTISGSRDCQPLNLQGQWNKSLRAPWSSNLTVNINTQMNYWGASRAGLEECISPLYTAVKEISERGKETAKTNYGARGFACNHNVDIWRNTSPVQGNPSYMYSPLCGAWLSNEAYFHKKNTGKIDDEIVEIVEQAAMFCLDYLTEHNGKLVTCPSTSPEAQFISQDGISAVGYSSAFDMAVINQAFVNTLQCSKNEKLKQEIAAAKELLIDYDVAENGIAEWQDGKTSKEKGHRHFSPLYGVYPGNTVVKDTIAYENAKKLFKHRIENSNSSIGWSAVWAMCLAAKFKDKDTAYKVMRNFTAKSIMDNLFDYHPPCYFQIDGNLGFVAAVNELLVSETDGVLNFLPACFGLISNGKMTGAVFNGIRVDFEWKNGEIIFAGASAPIKVKNENIGGNAKLINIETV